MFYIVLSLSQFKLICGEEDKLNNLQLAFSIGLVVGAIIAGWCSDRFGRRLPLLISLSMLIISVIWTVVSPSFISFALSRFATGQRQIISTRPWKVSVEVALCE